MREYKANPEIIIRYEPNESYKYLYILTAPDGKKVKWGGYAKSKEDLVKPLLEAINDIYKWYESKKI